MITTNEERQKRAAFAYLSQAVASLETARQYLRNAATLMPEAVKELNAHEAKISDERQALYASVVALEKGRIDEQA